MSVISDIKEAGKNKKLLRMVYKKKNGEITDRTVESYEIRGTRFFGYDVAKDEIREFIITGIIETEILEEEFEPRWEIKV